LAVLLGASPAAAELCGLTVYDSLRGVQSGEADRAFNKGDQFVVCFTPLEDGFASLWDRIPTNHPVERLVPNVNFKGSGTKAAKVSGGEEHCFGTGTDGYYLVMDPEDGDGRGLMFLIFQTDEAKHPTEDSFESSQKLASGYRRYGAGSIAVDEGAEDEAVETAPALTGGPSCPNGRRPNKVATYSYFVEE
ncbi:MAG: hypothetical protein AAFV62_14560, partial [Pseudomonadota bacterium]